MTRLIYYTLSGPGRRHVHAGYSIDRRKDEIKLRQCDAAKQLADNLHNHEMLAILEHKDNTCGNKLSYSLEGGELGGGGVSKQILRILSC